MKPIGVLIVLTFALLLSTIQTASPNPRTHEPAGKLSDLSWLVGTWHRQQAKGILYEQWRVVNDSIMSGERFTIKGSDTSVTERMKLVSVRSHVYFVAVVPHNDSAVQFGLTALDSAGALFENPDHDFPTRIRYRPISTDSMYVRIEGLINGQSRGIEFWFRRMQTK